MKLISNENFQFRGIHRVGVTLTVSEGMLREELEKGRHPGLKQGRHPWMSGLIEHTTPANQETADIIEGFSGEKEAPIKKKHNEKDYSDEIRDIRAEFESLGKAYNKRLGIKKLRLAIIKARKEVGQAKNKVEVEETIED